jgi:hypothetical protein
MPRNFEKGVLQACFEKKVVLLTSVATVIGPGSGLHPRTVQSVVIESKNRQALLGCHYKVSHDTWI